jgi:hypothetical protein
MSITSYYGPSIEAKKPEVRHVIIRGCIFPYEQKRPFVISGMSVLGATEYDKERDLLRCHECGNWFKGIGSHVLDAHGIASADYKTKHGLNQTSSLLNLEARRKISANNVKQKLSRNLIPKRPGADVKPRRHRVDVEARNERGACQAQTLFKIQTLAARLGRTPTIPELDAVGVRQFTTRRLFKDIPMAEIIEMAGLTPNSKRPYITGPRKPKAKLEERMPWPKDYNHGDVKIGSTLAVKA